MDVHSVDGFFEELLHCYFNDIAATAWHHWAGDIDVGVVALSPWGVNLLWVPLSEGVTSLLVLHLLRHNVDLGTGNILELHSHVSDLVTKFWCTSGMV